MPTTTFFNLPSQKQRSIVDLGYEEFSNNIYENANIRNIIKKANIGIGSFYRYFESKDEFYLYIIDYKMKEINSAEYKLENKGEVMSKFWTNFYKSGSEIRKKFYFRYKNNPLFSMNLEHIKEINSPYLSSAVEEDALAFALTVMPYIMHEFLLISDYDSDANSDLWLFLNKNILNLFSSDEE